MLDRKFILANVDQVKENVRKRNMRVDIDLFVQKDAERVALERRLQDINQRANEIARKTPTSGPEKDAAIETARALRAERTEAKDKLAALELEVDALQGAIPNMADARAPEGASDEANLVLGYGAAAKREFAFAPKDHVDLCEALDLLDMKAGSKVAGHGFYFLKNEAVLLDLALQRFAIDVLRKRGFTTLATPDLARIEMLAGTGYAPRGSETQIYMVEGTDLGLIATAEITLGGMYAGVTFDASELPLRLCGLSHCFRTEAGAHGRATRGLYRVHQFTKVEMFVFCTPDQSEAMHLEVLENERYIFDQLGVPYRYVENATGDLGAAAYRKFDLEAWMPGRGEWGEVTSASNCTDYQARRLRTRCKSGSEATLAHTLNGTAIATGRAMIAIVENYQRADGGIDMPKALQPYLGFDAILPRT